jgi:cytoplasmic iron level regulating protein YaaA (DUF328/UPF0246 family)
MTQRIALVACVKSKRSAASTAKDLYISPLFRGMRAYAEANSDAWFILSAQHGLLHPERVIDPYERTLNTMGVVDRRRWSEQVKRELAAVLSPNAEIVILAGERYREDLIPFLKSRGHNVVITFEGLPLGHQLRRLNEIAANRARNHQG